MRHTRAAHNNNMPHNARRWSPRSESDGRPPAYKAGATARLSYWGVRPSYRPNLTRKLRRDRPAGAGEGWAGRGEDDSPPHRPVLILAHPALAPPYWGSARPGCMPMSGSWSQRTGRTENTRARRSMEPSSGLPTAMPWTSSGVGSNWPGSPGRTGPVQKLASGPSPWSAHACSTMGAVQAARPCRTSQAGCGGAAPGCLVRQPVRPVQADPVSWGCKTGRRGSTCRPTHRKVRCVPWRPGDSEP